MGTAILSTASAGSRALDAYPVGSIYMSVISANPGTLFGGTWERIQDMFLLAAGTTYSAGSTGGEATHTLTVDEIPSHSHSYRDQGSYSSWTSSSSGDLNYKPVSGTTGSTGGGHAHNNMPPYIAVYVWKRTA